LVHVLALNVAENVVNRLWPAQGPPEMLNAPSAVALMLACLFSVIAAYILHRLVEKPCIEIGRRWAKRITDQSTKPVPLSAGVDRPASRPQRTEVQAGKMWGGQPCLSQRGSSYETCCDRAVQCPDLDYLHV